MKLLKLHIKNFRNYDEADFLFSENSNLITGSNAQGKTAILEAIHFLSSGKSFRTSKVREAISFESDSFEITANFKSQGRDFEIKLFLSQKIPFKISINGVKKKKISELLGYFKCISFCPEDLMLIRSAPRDRRKFLDDSITSLRPKYYSAISEYNRLLEHKNAILKNSENRPEMLALLDDYSLRMAHFGSFLINYRKSFCVKLSKYAEEIYSEISGGREDFSLIYKTVSNIDEELIQRVDIETALYEHYLSHKSAEIATKSCLSGPHKDDFEVYLSEKNTKQFASQGQVRSVALSLKLAVCKMIAEEDGEPPVLLLDDVLSELDEYRQKFILNKIKDGQTFITSCMPLIDGSMENGKIFVIKSGKLSENYNV